MVAMEITSTLSKGPEAVLQAKIMDMARLFGWRRTHFRTAYQPGAERWVTPMSGEKGFPDLVLVRPPRLIFAELKSKTGRLSLDQELWLADLERIPTGIEVYLWRPSDIDEIQAILKRESNATTNEDVRAGSTDRSNFANSNEQT